MALPQGVLGSDRADLILIFHRLQSAVEGFVRRVIPSGKMMVSRSFAKVKRKLPFS